MGEDNLSEEACAAVLDETLKKATRRRRSDAGNG